MPRTWIGFAGRAAGTTGTGAVSGWAMALELVARRGARAERIVLVLTPEGRLGCQRAVERVAAREPLEERDEGKRHEIDDGQDDAGPELGQELQDDVVADLG